MTSRVRKHANPFNCRVEVGLIDRLALFGREAPLEVELGPGSASFLFARARAHPEADFVGLEVRRPMAEGAMARRDREGPSNAVVLYANACENLVLARPGAIQRFHIHFPDPWPKRRHHKRRMVTPETVRRMAELLPIGGEVYAQTDVRALAEEMFGFFAEDGAFASRLDPSMRVARPFPECTDWERHHELANEPVFRMLFEKRHEPRGPIQSAGFKTLGSLSEI